MQVSPNFVFKKLSKLPSIGAFVCIFDLLMKKSQLTYFNQFQRRKEVSLYERMCLEKFGKLAATLAVNQQESVANKALANVRTLVVGEGHVGV